MKLRLALFGFVAVMMASCYSQHTCPTYMKKDTKEVKMDTRKV